MIFVRIVLSGPYPVKSKPIFDMINYYINQQYIDVIECANVYIKSVMHEKEWLIEVIKILDYPC